MLNVFSVDTLGAGRRETSAWTGAFDAVPLPGDGGLVVGGFHDLSWNLYRYPVDSAARADTFSLGDRGRRRGSGPGRCRRTASAIMRRSASPIAGG